MSQQEDTVVPGVKTFRIDSPVIVLALVVTAISAACCFVIFIYKILAKYRRPLSDAKKHENDDNPNHANFRGAKANGMWPSDTLPNQQTA